MASRKKKATNRSKQTRTTKKQSSKPSIEQAMPNDSSSAPTTQGLGSPQASMTGASPPSAGAPATGLAITEWSQKAVAQTHCPLFLLPPEIRIIIYKFVFDHETIVTGDSNKQTFTRIYTIDQPQNQHDLALLRTCRSIQAEIKQFVNPRSIIRDISAPSVVRRMHGDPRSRNHLLREVELLRKMTKLSVRICAQRSGNFNRFRSTDQFGKETLSLTFFDEEGPVGASGIADGGWAWILQKCFSRSGR